MAQAQSIITYQQGGKEALNIGYVIGNWADTAEFQQLADEYFDLLALNVLPLLSSDCSLFSVELRDLDTPAIATGVGAGPVAGGAAVSAENITAAVIITKGDTSSRYKGRIYQPGVSVVNVGAGGAIDPAWAANVTAAWVLVQTGLGLLFNSGVANRHTTGAPGAFIYALVTSWSFCPFVGIQRRRRFD